MKLMTLVLAGSQLFSKSHTSMVAAGAAGAEETRVFSGILVQTQDITGATTHHVDFPLGLAKNMSRVSDQVCCIT